MNEVRIIAIKVTDRIKESKRTQNVLSKYSKIIKTRFGYHELNEAKCSRVGYILLELQGPESEWNLLEKELEEIGGIQIKSISFDVYQSSNKDTYKSDLFTKEDDSIKILGLLVNNKVGDTVYLQDLLSSYGNCIKNRLGLHVDRLEQSFGLILLELSGSINEINAFQEKLQKLDYVITKGVSFN